MLIIFDHICWQCQPSLYLFHTTTHLTWQIENQIEHPMTDLIMRPRKRHNVFDDIMKMTASMEMRLDDILARVSGGRSKSSRMRCTLPRPFTSYSLEPSVPSSPCWQSTSRCFSPNIFHLTTKAWSARAWAWMLLNAGSWLEFGRSLSTLLHHSGMASRTGAFSHPHCEIHKYSTWPGVFIITF